MQQTGYTALCVFNCHFSCGTFLRLCTVNIVFRLQGFTGITDVCLVKQGSGRVSTRPCSPANRGCRVEDKVSVFRVILDLMAKPHSETSDIQRDFKAIRIKTTIIHDRRSQRRRTAKFRSICGDTSIKGDGMVVQSEGGSRVNSYNNRSNHNSLPFVLSDTATEHV